VFAHLSLPRRAGSNTFLFAEIDTSREAKTQAKCGLDGTALSSASFGRFFFDLASCEGVWCDCDAAERAASAPVHWLRRREQANRRGPRSLARSLRGGGREKQRDRKRGEARGGVVAVACSRRAGSYFCCACLAPDVDSLCLARARARACVVLFCMSMDVELPSP